MRKGYQRELRWDDHVESLIDPSGDTVAWADYSKRNRERGVLALVRSVTEGLESREVKDRTELRRVMDDFAERHYLLTTTRWQRFHDHLNKWVDYPLVKLLVVVAAVVAAVASMLTFLG